LVERGGKAKGGGERGGLNKVNNGGDRFKQMGVTPVRINKRPLKGKTKSTLGGREKRGG